MFSKAPRFSGKDDETPAPGPGHYVIKSQSSSVSAKMSTRALKSPTSLPNRESNEPGSSPKPLRRIAAISLDSLKVDEDSGDDVSGQKASGDSEPVSTELNAWSASSASTPASENGLDGSFSPAELDVAEKDSSASEITTTKIVNVDSDLIPEQDKKEVAEANTAQVDEAKICQLQEELTVMKKEKLEMLETVKTLHHEYKALRDVMRDNLSVVAVLREEKAAATAHCDELQSELHEVYDKTQSQLVQKDVCLEISKREYTRLQKRLDVYTSYCQAELDGAYNAVNYTKYEILKSQDNTAELKATIADLTAKLAISEEKVQKLNRMLEERQMETRATEEKLLSPVMNSDSTAEMESKVDKDKAYLKAEMDRWKNLHDELKEKYEDFEAKENGYTNDSAASLEHADKMGHQNVKQKIHYVRKLQGELNAMRQETTHLHGLVEKLKRQIRSCKFCCRMPLSVKGKEGD